MKAKRKLLCYLLAMLTIGISVSQPLLAAKHSKSHKRHGKHHKSSSSSSSSSSSEDRLAKPIKNDITRWNTGIFWHNGLNLEEDYTVIAEQIIHVTPSSNNFTGVTSLVTGETISTTLLPISNPPAGVDTAVASGTYFTEELWACTNEPEWVDNIQQRIIAVAADGKSYMGTNLQFTAAFPGQSTALVTANAANTPIELKLKRVRLSPLIYATWAGNMDNDGNVVIKSKYATNQNKNSQFYLLMAEEQDDGSWQIITPATDGPNLRTGDERQVVSWVVSGLKQGRKYTALATLATANLVTFINQELTYDSIFFREEVRRGSSGKGATIFQMPFSAHDKRDIRFTASSCNITLGSKAYDLISKTDRDFHLALGDSVYADFGGASLLNFNFPNNASVPLGFNLPSVPLAFFIYHQKSAVPPSPATPLTGLSPVAANTVINSSNNLFTVDGILYTIPSGTYATPASLAAAVGTLLGSDFSVTLNGSNHLVIDRANWSGYGYSEYYNNLIKVPSYRKHQSSAGFYTVADDHEVYNNYQSISAQYLHAFGTPTEVAISTAMFTNPAAILHRINYAPLSIAPVQTNPVANVDIDTALNEFNRYMNATFANTHSASGFVRWGEVELITLESTPSKDPLTGQYIYYDAQGKYMRDDQLAFLVDRLENSTAQVKIVQYSRPLALAFYTESEIQELKEEYVSIAVDAGYGSASDAATTFDKVFTLLETGFVEQALPWYHQIFLPAINATKAKNVFFIVGGNHYAHLARLTEDSPFIEIATTSMGTPNSGGTPTGSKNGFDPQIFTFSAPNGFSHVTVSPKKKTITVKFVSIYGDENSVTFPIVD